MPVTPTYNRSKSTTVNSTGIALNYLVGEGPITPHDLFDTDGELDLGTTGVLTAKLQADANESGGADVQDLFTIVVTPVLADSGVMTLNIVVTPIKGGGTSGNAQTLSVPHTENMDAWQTAAGRARQA